MQKLTKHKYRWIYDQIVCNAAVSDIKLHYIINQVGGCTSRVVEVFKEAGVLTPIIEGVYRVNKFNDHRSAMAALSCAARTRRSEGPAPRPIASYVQEDPQQDIPGAVGYEKIQQAVKEIRLAQSMIKAAADSIIEIIGK